MEIFGAYDFQAVEKGPVSPLQLNPLWQDEVTLFRPLLFYPPKCAEISNVFEE
jgi:hypothetical protein